MVRSVRVNPKMTSVIVAMHENADETLFHRTLLRNSSLVTIVH